MSHRFGVVRACAVAISGAVAYIAIDEDRSIRVTRAVKASSRICNLVGTAAIMAFDYGWTLRLAKENDTSTKYGALLSELRKLQQDQEDFTIAQFRTTSKAEVAQWQVLIDNTRRRIDAISEEMGNLQHTTQNSPIALCHQRNAVRLRDMCAANKGLYIKLGCETIVGLLAFNIHIYAESTELHFNLNLT